MQLQVRSYKQDEKHSGSGCCEGVGILADMLLRLRDLLLMKRSDLADDDDDDDSRRRLRSVVM